MLTDIEKQILRRKLNEYEGRIEHMYKDTKGFVTVGVGHLLQDLKAAQALDFINQASAKKATADEIKDDFEAILAAPAGLFAPLYKKYTKLRLTSTAIEELTNSHIDSFEKELSRLYGHVEFLRFPSEVKLALFDMIFNLGMTELRTGFPKFNRSIKANDWAEAAKESNRLDISPARNKYVKDLLIKAAQSARP